MVPTELQQVSKDQIKQCKLQYSHENIATLTQLLQYSHEKIHVSLVKHPQTNPLKDQMKQSGLQYSHDSIAICIQILQYSYDNVHISTIFLQKQRPDQKGE